MNVCSRSAPSQPLGIAKSITFTMLSSTSFSGRQIAVTVCLASNSLSLTNSDNDRAAALVSVSPSPRHSSLSAPRSTWRTSHPRRQRSSPTESDATLRFVRMWRAKLTANHSLTLFREDWMVSSTRQAYRAGRARLAPTLSTSEPWTSM